MPLVLALRYARSSRREASVRFLSAVTAGRHRARRRRADPRRGRALRLPDHVDRRGAGAQPAAPGRARAAASIPQRCAGRSRRSPRSSRRRPSWSATAGWCTREGSRPASSTGSRARCRSGSRARPESRSRASSFPTCSPSASASQSDSRVRVVSPRPTLTPFARQIPRSRSFPVQTVFSAGRSEEYESRVVLPLDAARALLWESDLRYDVELDVDAAPAVAERLRRQLPAGATVVTYRDLNRALFFALRLEKALMFVGVFLIVLVASQALVSSLALLIASKRRELGMLGTLGLTPARAAAHLPAAGRDPRRGRHRHRRRHRMSRRLGARPLPTHRAARAGLHRRLRAVPAATAPTCCRSSSPPSC